MHLLRSVRRFLQHVGFQLFGWRHAGLAGCRVLLGGIGLYSRSPKVGNPTASVLKSAVQGIPAPFVLNPASDILGFTIGFARVPSCFVGGSKDFLKLQGLVEFYREA